MEKTDAMPAKPDSLDPTATQWGQVRALADPARKTIWRDAWRHLQLRYRPAMVRYARFLLRRGGGGVCTPDEAEDVVQSFLLQCLDKDWLARAAPEHGRFRGFVRVLLARHTRDYIAMRRAKKRAPSGGQPVPIEPLADVLGDEAESQVGERLREEWADCMAGAALGRVRERSETNAQVLELRMKDPEISNAQLGERLAIAPKKMAMIVLRARSMFAEAVWEELKETVADPDEREDERRALFPALSPYMDIRRAPSFFGRLPEQ